MRNFNNDDLDKYEKMTKNAMAKFQSKTKINLKMPQFKAKNIFMSLFLFGFGYVGYRIYDYRSYRELHYIDPFQLK